MSGGNSVSKKEMKSLSLIFQFCPEKISVFDLNKEHNHFEFALAPVAEYFDYRPARRPSDVRHRDPETRHDQHQNIFGAGLRP